MAESVVSELFGGEAPLTATALLETVLTQWEDPAVSERLTALIRVAATHPEAGAAVSGLFDQSALGPLTDGITGDRPELRASLAAAQLAGLALLRLVIPVPPLVEASIEDLVAAVAPTVERYLTGDLGPAA